MTAQVSRDMGPTDLIRTETDNFISEKIALLIEAISKQFEGKGKLSKENRNELITMLRIMSSVLPCEAAEQCDLLFPILTKNLNDEDTDMYIKLESLAILRTILKTE